MNQWTRLTEYVQVSEDGFLVAASILLSLLGGRCPLDFLPLGTQLRAWQHCCTCYCFIYLFGVGQNRLVELDIGAMIAPCPASHVDGFDGQLAVPCSFGDHDQKFFDNFSLFGARP